MLRYWVLELNLGLELVIFYLLPFLFSKILFKFSKYLFIMDFEKGFEGAWTKQAIPRIEDRRMVGRGFAPVSLACLKWPVSKLVKIWIKIKEPYPL